MKNVLRWWRKLAIIHINQVGKDDGRARKEAFLGFSQMRLDFDFGIIYVFHNMLFFLLFNGAKDEEFVFYVRVTICDVF